MNQHTIAQQQKAITLSFMPVLSGILQRKCACGQHTVAGGECAECRKKRLQRKTTGHTDPETVPPIVHEVLRSPGQSLDAETRAFMEPRFGHDFSRVRVHTGARAVESTRAVNALAYTVGQDVVFGAGQYVLGTSEGKRLLAHELTHTVQQNRNSFPNNLFIRKSNTYETEANKAAEVILQTNELHEMQNFSFSKITGLQRQVDGSEEDTAVQSNVLGNGRNIRYRCGALGCPLIVECEGRPCAVSDCGRGTCPTCPPGFGNIIWKAWCSYRCVPSGSAFIFITSIGGVKVGPFCLD
jgi:hypothetical protein